MAASYSPNLSIIDSLPPPPSSVDFPLGQLPPLLSSGDSPSDSSILNPLPPPMLPLDTYDLQYGPSSSTEPQLDTPTQDGTIPSFDEMDEQYNFLRRTLSHSRGRYSARYKRPRPKPQSPERNDDQTSLDAPGKKREDTEYRIPAPSKSGPHPLAKHHTVRGTNVQSEYTRQSQKKNIDRRSSPSTVRNKHVDSLGRQYIVDHETHTVQYGSPSGEGSDNIPGSQGRREMLNRRYESLQRSFRSAHHQRRIQTANNLSPGESAGAISYLPGNRRDSTNDDMATPTPVTPTNRGSNKKDQKKSRWFSLGRNKHRTVSQSAPEPQDNNIIPIVSPDILSPITPPPSLDDLGISLPLSSSQTNSISNGELEREPDLDESMRMGLSQYGNESNRNSVTAILDAMSTSERQSHPQNTDKPRPQVADEPRPQDTDEARPQSSTPPISPTQRATDLDRMMQVQRKISQSRMTRRSQHEDGGDTDEETDERPSPRASVEPTDTTNGGQQAEEDKENQQQEQQQFSRQRSSKRKLSRGLTESPALKFITRPDLYTFLNSAGEAGEEFISNRALVELVQRIRSQTNLFEKYQHSRHLVKALNRFVDEETELPKGWEKKLNKQGRVFFIDHVNFITTFIDPRLPLDNDDQLKSRKTSVQAPQNVRRVYSVSEEPELRGHHSTVVQTTSLPDNSIPTENITTSNEHASYESQIVAFLRQPDVIDKINHRYRRGVKPSLAEAIEDIKANGVPGLERVQLAGGTAAYELGLILSMFDEEVNAMTPQSTTTGTTPNITVSSPATSPTNTLDSSATLQRQKQAFSAKLQTFKLQLARLGFAQSSRLKFNLRRDHMLEDAYEHIMKSEIRHLQRKRLNIAFKGEEGLDYGGPSREFFFLVSREIFNPYFGLFEYSANDTYTVQISSTSCFIRNNLDWLRFAGRIIGLAIAQGFLLDVFFTRPFYKILLKRPPTLTDLESLEPAFYSSLLWIKDNDPAPLDLTFTVEEEAFGQLTTHELKEGGLDIPVLEENKKEYVDLMLKWRLDRGTQDQSNALMKGFNEIMPVSLIQQFDAQELEFIIAGTLEIDIDDWRANTDYRNGYHATHPVILWFWKAVETFDNEQRLRLLQFITGTSSVPYEGFKALRGSSGPKRFTIDFFNDVRSLPRSHTCFNRLDLPPYPSFEILYEKLRVAVEEGGTFGAE